MSTRISWTDETWNPTTGCSRVSEGCRFCYAEALSLRLGWSKKPWTHKNAQENLRLHPERLNKPRTWTTPRRVFVNSMSDLFHELIPDSFIAEVFSIMADLPQHTFQVLTKRPERAAAWTGPWTDNIWMGTSVEDRQVIHRIDALRQCKAHLRFLSFEPLLAPLGEIDLTGIHWVIVGGESGAHYRPMDHAWVREIRNQCVTHGIAFFFKQSAAPRSEMGTMLLEEDGSAAQWWQYPNNQYMPKSIRKKASVPSFPSSSLTRQKHISTSHNFAVNEVNIDNGLEERKTDKKRGTSTNEGFFEETREQSVVKAKIVSGYFSAWAKVMISTVKQTKDRRIAYIDLFAGPGRYKDGTKSTPLLVLEKAIQDPDMSKMLVTIFNDGNQDHSYSLDQAIRSLPGIEKLQYKPEVHNHIIGKKIIAIFSEIKVIPTLLFVDPWGYKGLSIQLVNSVLKDWGCDVIFFFNYNRINMGLSNSAVKEHMDALFTEKRANSLRERLPRLDSSDRELAIIKELTNAFIELGAKYVLPFCFKTEDGARTSHHLIFTTKHFRGYDIMKGIMASQSSSADQGVPSFTYNPVDNKSSSLFGPLDDLEDALPQDFRGRKLSLKALYEEHGAGRPYLLKNYRDVLRKLESAGKISVDPPADRRRKINDEVTLKKEAIITFPR
jgi:three-Cys-motif partner protein